MQVPSRDAPRNEPSGRGGKRTGYQSDKEGLDKREDGKLADLYLIQNACKKSVEDKVRCVEDQLLACEKGGASRNIVQVRGLRQSTAVLATERELLLAYAWPATSDHCPPFDHGPFKQVTVSARRTDALERTGSWNPCAPTRGAVFSEYFLSSVLLPLPFPLPPCRFL